MGDLPLTPFPRQALGAPAEEVAPALLGALLVSDLPAGRVVLRLTEVEAYAGESDPGSHAFRGRTPRTEVMFGPAGALYVYFSYGMHWCANVVCGPSGSAAAVLLRAGEVLEGEPVAFARRPACRSARDLARGPARLCQALGIDGTHDNLDLYADATPLHLLAGPPVDPALVRSGPRVGVGGAGAATPWRFRLEGEKSVSAYRAHTPRGRR